MQYALALLARMLSADPARARLFHEPGGAGGGGGGGGGSGGGEGGGGGGGAAQDPYGVFLRCAAVQRGMGEEERAPLEALNARGQAGRLEQALLTKHAYPKTPSLKHTSPPKHKCETHT